MKLNKNIPKAVKIGLFGDSQVGKSAICKTFLGFEFTLDMIGTIGVERYQKKLK